MLYETKNIDPLKWFCMPEDIKEWVAKYECATEGSLVKQVPLTEFNKNMIKRISKVFKIQRRYRGPRAKNIHRECHKHLAERVSVYIR